MQLPNNHSTSNHPTNPPGAGQRRTLLSSFIFASRWLQLPLYLGLIIAQVVYVILFGEELWHLIELLWKDSAMTEAISRMGLIPTPEVAKELQLYAKPPSKETVIMLIVLSLIDVVMISNLLIMVIVGGYETFVSRLHLDDHPDQPEWLSHVNANVLKVKLATAIIGISSIHLLKTFISAESLTTKALLWQTIIHVAFLLSAVSIAWIDRLMYPVPKKQDH